MSVVVFSNGYLKFYFLKITITIQYVNFLLQLTSLFHYSVTLKISELYHFKFMEVKLINKVSCVCVCVYV